MIQERTKSVYEDKINLLRMVTNGVDGSSTTDPTEGSGTTASRLRTALQTEVLYARTQQKTLDILEICSGETLGKLGVLLTDQKTLVNNTDAQPERTIFWDMSSTPFFRQLVSHSANDLHMLF